VICILLIVYVFSGDDWMFVIGGEDGLLWFFDLISGKL